MTALSTNVSLRAISYYVNTYLYYHCVCTFALFTCLEIIIYKYFSVPCVLILRVFWHVLLYAFSSPWFSTYKDDVDSILMEY